MKQLVMFVAISLFVVTAASFAEAIDQYPYDWGSAWRAEMATKYVVRALQL